MIIDDRLDTVLRTEAVGVNAARIQYRQLVDLLGRLPAHEPLPVRALERVAELDSRVPLRDREAILRGIGPVLRHPELVLMLGSEAPPIAAAAIASARLGDDDWAALIGTLPVHARGFLRHRRDLGPQARQMLARFGIGDLALPLPEGYVATAEEAVPAPAEGDGIAAIVRRIEALRRSRESAPDELPQGEARLPLSDQAPPPAPPLTLVEFVSDPDGRIVWAADGCAPMVVGLRLGARAASSPARSDSPVAAALARRAPIRAGRVEIDGAPRLAGAWRIDAAPRFDPASGGFLGHRGVLRRPQPAAAAAGADSASDRLRQVLHELRTPVNAIQGFAELIQQQLFGAVSHNYRGLAATIAADAAQILAGFDEIDQLVRFETGRHPDLAGRSDLAALARRLVGRLAPGAAARDVAVLLDAPAPAPVAIAEEEAERMLWRVLAVLSDAAGAGERIELDFAARGDGVELAMTLPATLAAREPCALFAVEPAATGEPGRLAPSLLGGGFALRLAAAEARAAGGSLRREGDRLVLHLPGLTPPLADAHTGEEGARDARSG